MWQRADFWPSERVEAPISPESDAYARGLADGRATVEAELAGEREALVQLMHGLEALEVPEPGRLATMMMTAVERLVSDIAGDAPVDRALLAERAEALAACMTTETEAVLVAHPDDAALLGGRATADTTLLRGTVQVRAGDRTVEDGVQTALERLRARICDLGIAL